MIAKTRAEFPLKVSTKRSTQNYCFQESDWLPQSNSWKQKFYLSEFVMMDLEIYPTDQQI